MLSTALSALQSERKALEVTGQNVANANTPGYTRQRALLQAVGGSVQPALYSTSDGIGAGVNVHEVQRLQDGFLEQRANTENGTLASLQSTQQTLEDIENSFGEPGDTGIQHLMSQYAAGWSDVANNPPDSGARTALLGDAQAIATALNGAAAGLQAQWASTSQSLNSTVRQINDAATNIAALNKAIVAASAAGNSPNDLMDQRDGLIRQLATMTGVTTRANANGSTDVLINGAGLVTGDVARQIQVGGATALDQVGTTPVSLTWADTGYAVGASAGQVGAMMTTLNTTIPSYSSQLDDVASSLATSVNTQQAAGYDLAGAAGVAFFDPSDGSAITAANIRVAITDPDQIAASATAPDPGPPVQPNNDGANAQTMSDATLSSTDDLYRKMIVKLGSQSQSVQQKAATQQNVVLQVEASRDSMSGVDLDEEQTNMVTYQQAYNAAAQYLTVINGLLDTLINHMLV